MTNTHVLLSKDQLWQVTADLPCEDVTIREPAAGKVVGVMRVRGLRGHEVNEWQDKAVEQRGRTRRQSQHSMALLVVMSAVDADGGQYFEPHEVLKVTQMPGYFLNQLVDVALRLSGLTEDDAKDLIEGFGDAPSEDSTSG
ncbi:hypothetical protein [Nonomuraea endophytica]|uniref:hypothetical protein n=1 Tax=Nonomuraea endophytica TaxID=714136 RepID=UPI0037CC433F